MARERYNWLDIMKLIAIWLMYTTHYDGMGRFGILGLYSVLGILFFSSGFTAFTSSIIGRRSSSAISGMEARASALGRASSTAARVKPVRRRPPRIWARVWCCFVTSQPTKRVVRGPGRK